MLRLPIILSCCLDAVMQQIFFACWIPGGSKLQFIVHGQNMHKSQFINICLHVESLDHHMIIISFQEIQCIITFSKLILEMIHHHSGEDPGNTYSNVFC